MNARFPPKYHQAHNATAIKQILNIFATSQTRRQQKNKVVYGLTAVACH